MAGLLGVSIVGGCALRWLIFPIPYVIILPTIIKLIVLIVCFSGGFCGYYLSQASLYIKSKTIKNFLIVYFAGSIWFIPIISTLGANYTLLQWGLNFIKTTDYGWSEKLGGQNLNYNISLTSKYFQFLQHNRLKIYLIFFFLWVCIYIILSVYLNSLY